MKKRKILVTAGLPYSNGRPHVGHVAGAYLPADIYVRFQKLRGHDVRYVCGSDDFGVAIMLAAQKEGKKPQEIVNFYNSKQQEDFKGINIHFDIYGSTSQSPYHTKVSQKFFQSMYDKGYFKKQKTEQYYDEKNDLFLPDRFIKGTCGFCGALDQNGDQCENCGKLLDIHTLKNAKSTMSGESAIIKETLHWFLDLSPFKDRVEAWLEKAVLRDHTKNYVKSLIHQGLQSRSMTRDLTWGIPLPISDPDAKGKVLYVWFDAPIGYISNTVEMGVKEGKGEEDYKKWWSSDDSEIYHFVGEDNTIFHCLIWIAMLSAEGSYHLPRGVIVNQFLNFQKNKEEEAQKISKSRGLGVWIQEYLTTGGDSDVLRYYLTSISPERARTVYNTEELIGKNNSDLANVLGNFINRTLSFHLNFFGEAALKVDETKLQAIDQEFLNNLNLSFQKITELQDTFHFKDALHETMELCRNSNKYMNDKAPWKERKVNEEGAKLSIAVSLKAIQMLGVLLLPFMPEKSALILDSIGLNKSNLGRELNWQDALIALPSESKIKLPPVLFQKIEN